VCSVWCAEVYWGVLWCVEVYWGVIEKNRWKETETRKITKGHHRWLLSHPKDTKSIRCPIESTSYVTLWHAEWYWGVDSGLPLWSSWWVYGGCFRRRLTKRVFRFLYQNYRLHLKHPKAPKASKRNTNAFYARFLKCATLSYIYYRDNYRLAVIVTPYIPIDIVYL